MKYDLELLNPDILNLGIKSIIIFYNAISVDKLQHEGSFAFVTGVPSPFLNVIIDIRKDRNRSKELLDKFSQFFQTHNIPWAWFIDPSSYENDLEDLGLSLIEEAPAMYFDLQQDLPFNLVNEEIRIQELDRNNDLKTWIIPIKEAYEASEDDDSFRKLNYKILQSGSDQFKHFIAFKDNEVVGAGTLFCSDDSVMLHHLATMKAHTKQGIGTALTIFMMEQAKRLGFKHCFLDSSKDGFNMYKRIGFKIYSTNLAYSNT